MVPTALLTNGFYKMTGQEGFSIMFLLNKNIITQNRRKCKVFVLTNSFCCVSMYLQLSRVYAAGRAALVEYREINKEEKTENGEDH